MGGKRREGTCERDCIEKKTEKERGLSHPDLRSEKEMQLFDERILRVEIS
jgi:hypothetical protein